jgi:hypothetical protein
MRGMAEERGKRRIANLKFQKRQRARAVRGSEFAEERYEADGEEQSNAQDDHCGEIRLIETSAK